MNECQLLEYQTGDSRYIMVHEQHVILLPSNSAAYTTLQTAACYSASSSRVCALVGCSDSEGGVGTQQHISVAVNMCTLKIQVKVKHRCNHSE